MIVVRYHYVLAAHSSQVGIDTQGGIYHTFFAVERDTALFEVRLGT